MSEAVGLPTGRLRRIAMLSEGVYEIELITADGENLVSTARIARAALGDETGIELVTFDSEDLNKAISRGRIYARNLCGVIMAFHRFAVPP